MIDFHLDKMFHVFLALSSSKLEFLDSEWDVYGLINQGKKRYTAEIHQLKKSENYFLSFWDDNNNYDAGVLTPDEAMLAQANFSIKKNKVNCVATFNKRRFNFETEIVDEANNEKSIEVLVDGITSLTIKIVNESYFTAEISQIGKGKVASLVGKSHYKFKRHFILSNKIISYGAVVVFLILQIRSTIKNYKEGKEMSNNEQKKEINEFMDNAHIVKDDEKEKGKKKENKNKKATKNQKKDKAKKE